MLILIIISTLSIALISFAGALALFFKEAILKRIVLFLVALSAGAMIGGAFFHLLPESINELGLNNKVFITIIIGFSFFFLMEQFIQWHHCHKTPSEHVHPFTYLVLISDAIHNFIDGFIIGSSFIFSVNLGITTTLVVAFHEIPQELGDFGILIHGGWKKSKALLFNFLSALSVVIGGIVAYFFAQKFNVTILLPFAVGSFLYIACSDLIPEIKRHPKLKESLLHFFFFILGIFIIIILKD